MRAFLFPPSVLLVPFLEKMKVLSREIAITLEFDQQMYFFFFSDVALKTILEVRDSIANRPWNALEKWEFRRYNNSKVRAR